MDIASLLANVNTDSQNNLNEPVAIIGTACRLPGGVRSLKSLGDVLINETEVMSELPASLYERDQSNLSTVRGGLIDDVFDFDPQLFGISPREAVAMDPQQRMTLKLAWELFDDAGMTKQEYADSNTGVFVGVSENTYADHITDALDKESSLYLPTGNALNAIAGRISHCFHFSGPSITLDTACSSSLIAICLAVNALRTGECDTAVAGGINIMLDEGRTKLLLDVGMLSATGHCKVFDKAANGYVRSEGAGLVLLKTLSAAEKDQDTILGVIKGTAFNHNASSAGLTVPSGPAQIKVMEQALKDAGMGSQAINWIEAHGTGTKMGDPIEYSSIAQVFSSDCGNLNSANLPHQYMTSSKSQFGHTESAAGVVSILKTLAVMQARCLPKQFDFNDINPEIARIDSSIQVPTEHIAFTDTGPIRAVVNSFGFSGANASSVIESYRCADTPADTCAERTDADTQNTHVYSKNQPLGMVCLSGTDRQSLINQANALSDVLFDSETAVDNELISEKNKTAFDGYALEALMNGNKTHLKEREALVYTDKSDLLTQLQSLSRSGQSREKASDTVFLFPGQGSQYINMAETLRQQLPGFDNVLSVVIEKFNDRLDINLSDIMHSTDASVLNGSTLYTQCAIFSVSYAFATSLIQLGVKPDYMIGHSVGEIAACAVAGVWSLDDACDIIVKRGRLMESPSSQGRMLSILADIDSVHSWIQQSQCQVDIAGINGLEQVVVSADQANIDRLTQWLEAKGIPCIQLNVEYAFHSRYMQDAAEQLSRYIAGKDAKPPVYTIVSTLTAEVECERFTDSEYWQQQLLSKVNFLGAVGQVSNLRAPLFIECGVNDVLINCTASILAGKTAAANNSSVASPSAAKQAVYTYGERPRDKGQSNVKPFLCTLYTQGLDLDWRQVYPRGVLSADNPFKFPYRFNETVFRPHNKTGVGQHNNTRGVSYHASPLLAHKSADCPFDLDVHSYLLHHVIFEEYVAPGAMHCCFALDAAQNLYGKNACYEITDVYFLEAAVCYENEPRVLQIVIENIDGELHFKTLSFARNQAEFANVVEHAKGKISVTPTDEPGKQLSIEAVKNQLTESETITGTRFYDQLRTIADMNLGASFTWVKGMQATESAAIAQFRREDAYEKSPFLYEPGLLDTCFQVIGSLPLIHVSEPITYVPFTVGRVTVYQEQAGAQVYRCFAEVTNFPTPETPFVSGNALLLDENDNPVISVEGLVVKKIDKPRFLRRESDNLLTIDRYRYVVEEDTRYALNTLSFVDDMKNFISHDDVTVLYEQLNNLSCHYARAAIEQVSPDMIQTEICQKLWRRLEEFANTHTDSATDYANIDDRIGQLKQDYPIISSEVDLVAHCGPHLASVLTGDVLGSNVLFPENDAGIVSNIYQKSELSHLINGNLAASLAHAIRQYQFDRPVRILEIGGGTGGTTQYVLNALEGVELDYCFTDISPLFVNQAKEKFGDQCARYQVLDIEKSPRDQGFEAEDYDFVLCANVIHAARDMEIALKHINALLVRGGGVVLLEGNGKQPWLDVTFGLTDGWWHFTDFRVDGEYPLIESDQWQALLSDNGFSAPEITEENSRLPQIVYQFAKERSVTRPGNILLISESAFTPLADQVNELLEQAGSQVTRIELPEAQFSGRTLDTLAVLEDILSQGRTYSVVYVTSGMLDTIHQDNDSEAINVLLHKTVSLIQCIKKYLNETVADFSVINSLAVDHGETYIATPPGIIETALNTLSFETLAKEIRYFETDAVNADLIESLLSESTTAHVIYRQGKRYLRAIAPDYSEVPATGKTVSSEKSYVITGANAGLSDSLIEFLIDQGARRIDLLSRSAIDLSSRGWYGEVHQKNIDVVTHRCDVTSQASVNSAIEAITDAGFDIDGLFHLVGLLDDALIEHQTDQSLATVIDQKVTGIQNLLRALNGTELNWFVMYSSAAAMLGTPGQINHALANACLDSLVSYRRAQGLAGQSIAWGPWSEVGAANKAGMDVFMDKGLDKFSESEGKRVLTEALLKDLAYLAPIKLNWNGFLNTFSDSLAGRLLDKGYRTSLSQLNDQFDNVNYLSVDELCELDAGARQQAVAELLKQLLSRTLNIEVDTLSTSDQLQDIGLDSLTAIEVIGRVKTLYQVEIPAKIFLDNISIDTLAENTLELLAGKSDQPEMEDEQLEGVL